MLTPRGQSTSDETAYKILSLAVCGIADLQLFAPGG